MAEVGNFGFQRAVTVAGRSHNAAPTESLWPPRSPSRLRRGLVDRPASRSGYYRRMPHSRGKSARHRPTPRGGQRGGQRHRSDSHRSGHAGGGDSDRAERRQATGEVTKRPRKPWSPDGGQLPNWVSEQLARVTPKAKLAAAADHLLAAAGYFSSGKHGKALHEAQQAKELSPRDATIREILALSAYRLGRWDLALRELRTFRRFTGEDTHMPVEMDVLRALDRGADIESVWKAFNGMRGGMRSTRDEARVVFGSFLLDTGDARRAWEVTDPRRMSANPEESELRVWYVASRAAHRLGDKVTARQIYQAIEEADTAFPGLDELSRELRND